MYNGNEWVQFEEEDGLAGPRVRRMAVDGQNNVWVCTSTGVTKISDIPSNIVDHNIESNLLVYPNPAQDYFYVSSDYPDPNYQIVDLNGKTIKSGLLPSDHKIMVFDLEVGIYILIMDDTFQRIQVLR